MYEDRQGQKVKSAPQKSSGAKRRLRLLFFASICFFVWAGLALMDRIDVHENKNAKLAQLEQQRDELQIENENFHQEIAKMDDPEYIEQILRKEYQMTKEDEILFIRTR